MEFRITTHELYNDQILYCPIVSFSLPEIKFLIEHFSKEHPTIKKLENDKMWNAFGNIWFSMNDFILFVVPKQLIFPIIRSGVVFTMEFSITQIGKEFHLKVMTAIKDEQKYLTVHPFYEDIDDSKILLDDCYESLSVGLKNLIGKKIIKTHTQGYIPRALLNEESE